ETFKKLRDDYIGRISTHTALVTADIGVTVNAIRFDQVLQKLRPVAIDQVNRGVCLPNTRLGTIKSILDWYSNDSDNHESVLWVHGLAGTGKSTLSTTIARMVEDLNLLGAFFFFDRQLPERDTSTLIRTVAYQLAQFDSSIGAKVEQVLLDTPHIANLPLAIQFSKLLSTTALGDIEWSRGPILVIIDALDESGSATDRKGLLKVFSEGFSDLPWFLRLLIVSRPERDILDRFKHCSIRREELGVDSNLNQEDVAEFIRFRLNEIREDNIDYLTEALQDWPSEVEIQALAALAAGLFIWAATACHLIDTSHNPKEQTNQLIKHHSADAYASIFASLHQLYKTALQSAGNWNDQTFCSDFRDILGMIICAQVPLSCIAVDRLLGLPRPSMQTVSRLGSLIRGDREQPIRILHASFHDYLTLRDLIEPWAINDERYNIHVANRCIEHLQQELRENMCDLALPHPVHDETLSDSVSYACKFWIHHVCSITVVPGDLCDKIYQFIIIHLLHWLEALVIMKAYRVAMQSLPRLLEWIQSYLPSSPLFYFVHDAHRFAQYFASTIQQHPLLIYSSALPFTPRGTLVYRQFYHQGLPRVVSGIEPEWPAVLQVLSGHAAGMVGSVAFSPDGCKIASACGDGTVRVWDTLTGQEILPPLRHNDGVSSVAFSPDGSKIVSGSYDGTTCVWDAFSGKMALPPIRGHEKTFTYAAFSPDGCKIVSGSGSTIRMLDTLTGQDVSRPMQGFEGHVICVAFSPKEPKIISAASDKVIRVWDTLTGNETLPPITGQGLVSALAFSPDGSKFVSACDQTVRVWNTLTGQEARQPLQGHTDVMSVTFSHDGSKIVSAGADKIVRIWNAFTGQNTILELEVGNVVSVAISPDGSKIVTGLIDNTVRVWDAIRGQQSRRVPLPGHNDGWVSAIAFSPDGSKIVSGSWSTLLLWDALIGQEAFPPLQMNNAVGSDTLAFSHDGGRIVSGLTREGTIRIWDVPTGIETTPSPMYHKQVASVAFSPDGCRIVSGGDKTVRVWDILAEQEALPPLLGHEEEVTSVAFSHDGCKVVSGSRSTIRVWDIATGQEVLPPLQRDEKSAIASLAFTSDGSSIILNSNDGIIRAWDVATGMPQLVRADNPLKKLVRLDKSGYFMEVVSGRYLSKVPTGFKTFTSSLCTMVDLHSANRLLVQIGSYNTNLQGGEGLPQDLVDWLSPTLQVSTFLSRVPRAPDIVAVGFQELLPLHLGLSGISQSLIADRAALIKSQIELHAPAKGETYSLVGTIVNVGVALLVFARDAGVARQICDVQTNWTGTGPLWMGNKGAVGLRFRVKGADGGAGEVFTFVCAHLTAHEPKLAQRVADYNHIVGSLLFDAPSHSPSPYNSKSNIYETSHLFFLGDLNFRVALPAAHPLKSLVAEGVHQEDMREQLKEHDQLIVERRKGNVFVGLREGDFWKFQCSYKYKLGEVDKYSTKRTPSWTDRIMYTTYTDTPDTPEISNIDNLLYTSIPSYTTSDHKPVICLLLLPAPSATSLTSPPLLRLPASFHPTPDRHAVVKRYIGRTLDRLIGYAWWLVTLFGMGSTAIGIFNFLLGIGAWKWWGSRSTGAIAIP
ncbi:hypothetical protein HWV62_15166, partial [Athelia sp. TMB]